MKKLGYEGVDVRHLPSFDDTEYGSVIYDLKTNDTLQATTEPTTTETIPNEQIIEEDKTSVKTSDKDSNGNILSKEQREILKDSKLRDKDGNIYY